ncbi:MAG TPA: glycosyltransferase [Terriglobales bacterium]
MATDAAIPSRTTRDESAPEPSPPEEPIRVLHLLGTAQPEGASIAKSVGLLTKLLDAGRFESSVMFLGGDGPWRVVLGEGGMRVRLLEWQGGLRFPVTLMRFWRVLRQERCDIVHQHIGGQGPLWVAGNTNIATVLHVWSHLNESHSVEPTWIDGGRADRVIAISKTVASRISGVRPIVIYPGIELLPQPQRPLDEAVRTMTVGAAGRLVPMKGFQNLIRAIALVRNTIPQVRLEIAGSGPEEHALRAEAQEARVSDCVHLLGWQPDLPAVLSRWEVYAQPSLAEPFGIAAVEASAAGLPVIGTTGTGLEEVVEHGKTGLLVPPADSAALANAIIALLNDRPRRLRMGAAGRQRVAERFAVARMAREIEGVYDSLLVL